MVQELGYPIHYLSIERKIDQLPHLAGEKLPVRRSDIICYGEGIHKDHALYPLLLIECKAVKITQKVLQQVIGYNHFLKSYFICAANDQQVLTGYQDSEAKKYSFFEGLPSYAQLLNALKLK